MSQATASAFEHTIEVTHQWLKDLMRDLDYADRDAAYHALRAVLHALRDRLTVEEAADLAAQLPMLIRGFYYEGWRPTGKPIKAHRHEFLRHVSRELGGKTDWEAQHIVQAMFRLLKQHVSAGEIEDVLDVLPDDLKQLWPTHT